LEEVTKIEEKRYLWDLKLKDGFIHQVRLTNAEEKELKTRFKSIKWIKKH